MEKASESVKELVEDLGASKREFLFPNYQESHVQQDFIDKFFIVLGWDVRDQHQTGQVAYHCDGLTEERIKKVRTADGRR